LEGEKLNERASRFGGTFGALFFTRNQIDFLFIRIFFLHATMDDKENLPENVALSQSSQQGSQPQYSATQKQNAPRLLITKLVLENFKSYAGINAPNIF
jgi:hypothetical protein